MLISELGLTLTSVGTKPVSRILILPVFLVISGGGGVTGRNCTGMILLQPEINTPEINKSSKKGVLLNLIFFLGY